MQKPLNNSIPSVLAFSTLLFIASCFRVEPEIVETVEVKTVEVAPPKPIVPTPDPLQLRETQWIVITPENIDQSFESVEGEKVFFALTVDGYEALALNISDIRALIQQQQAIIAIYEDSF